MRRREPLTTVCRFGPFVLNRQAGELRKNGVRLKLQQKPLQLLCLLLANAGNIVNRNQIRSALWPPDVHVDYDNAINSAVRKLREALCDSSERPRFIETVARDGYRFIGEIEPSGGEIDLLATRPAPRANYTHHLLIAAPAIIVAAVVLSLFYFSRLPDASAFTSVPLTANPGIEGEPSFSPDGTQIAYSWDGGSTGDHETQTSHIYVKLIGEGKPLRVTAGTQLDTSPAWSPDGRWIAFARTVDRAGGIYLVPALGGRERLVTTAYLPSRQLSAPTLSWSPDSRSLAIAESTSPGLPASLSLINVESGMRTQLTRSTDARTADTNPVFSPDGRSLLFTRCSLRCQLYIVKLGKDYHPLEDPRPLSRFAGLSVVPGAAWTPNGLDIVYSLSDSDYRASLFRIRNDKSARSLLFKDAAPQLPSLPVIAPRGNSLAYVDESEDFQIWRVDQGRPARRFVFSSRTDETPQYSPDGRRVAFASNRSGRIHQIWLCDPDGSDPMQLTHFTQGDSGTPRWAPDAHSIVFDHFTEQGWRVFIIGSDGTRLRRLTSEDVFEAIPSWSADGRWIYYTSDRSGRHEIWKASTRGGRGVRVTRDSGYTAFDCPARRSLIYTKAPAAGIWELPWEGGQEKLLLPSGGGEREFAIVPDGVYYLSAPGTDEFRSVRFQSFTSNETKEIASLNVATAEGLAVSPDRQTVLFTAATRSASNVMIVGNFH